MNRLTKTLLLLGMGLMIPCYLFVAGNTLLAPWPLYDRNRAALCILTALFLAALLLLLRAVGRHEAFLIRHDNKIVLFAAVFYFAVQMLMAHALRFVPKTDAEQCFTAAKLLVDAGTFGTNERSFVYFTRYPHNLGMVYLLAGIFKVFGALGWADRFMQAALVCTALFSLGLVCAARAAKRMGGVKAQARMLILFLSSLPLIYCTSELYTDAFSVAFPMIIVYCFLRVKEAEGMKGRALWALLFGLATFIGAQIRFTAVIAAIACLIALLLERRGRALAFAAAALAAAFLLCGAAMDAYTHRHLAKEDIEKYELPKLHYIAMGLPIHEEDGYGQYGDGGWLIFSTSFDDPGERDAALLTHVIDKVYYLRYPSRMVNMLSRKLLSTFGTGTFMLNEIIEADSHEPDSAVKQIIFNEGRFSRAYYHIATALLAAQMMIACMACLAAIRRRDTSSAPLYIALLGVFLFLCIWESRGRYFFQFVPLLLCAGAMPLEGIKRNKP